MSTPDRDALAAAIGADVDEWVIDAIQDNRDDVLSALGAEVELDWEYEQPLVRRTRWVLPWVERDTTGWEDVTDER